MKKSSIVLGSFMVLALLATGAKAADTFFKDVPTTHWGYAAVNWLKTSGVVVGYTDNTFKGDQNITRYEMASIMSKYNTMLTKDMDAMEKEMMDKMAAMQKEMDAMEAKMDDMGDDVTPPVAEKEMYYTGLTGSQEVPAVNTTAKGTGDFWVQSGKLMYDIEVSGLSGAITGAHIHAGAAGAEGDPVHTITFTGNTAEGSWDFTDADWTKLKDGMFYVNIHTAANPEGEIRGQIFPQMYMATLNGASEVPAVVTDATGTASLWIEDGKLMYKVTVKDLSGAITGAHIQMAAKGAEGDSVHNLTFVGNVAEGSWTLDEEDWMDLADEMLYLNVQTAANPDGEIRGQVMPDFM